MHFFEEIIIDAGREGIYFLIKRIGILFKWLIYRGRRPFSQIKNENWNTRIGFIICAIGIGWIIYYVNYISSLALLSFAIFRNFTL